MSHPEAPRTGDVLSVWGVDYDVVGHLASEDPVRAGVIHVHLILKARGMTPTPRPPGVEPQG